MKRCKQCARRYFWANPSGYCRACTKKQASKSTVTESKTSPVRNNTTDTDYDYDYNITESKPFNSYEPSSTYEPTSSSYSSYESSSSSSSSSYDSGSSSSGGSDY